MTNLLAIDDVAEDLQDILQWAIAFKNDTDIAFDFTPLDRMSIGCIFEKPSTRTRVSFEVGINKLGGQALVLVKGDIQIGKSETVGDTAQVLSRFLDGLTYRCFDHADVVELAEKATVPVINALSDMHHPCQAAADLMTVIENSNDLKGAKMAYVGDGNNVLHDLMLACAILGMDCTWATPKGYEPDEEVVSRAQKFADETGCTLTATTDPVEAVTGAHYIYTDVFISMGEEHLTDKADDFAGFQVNLELLKNADANWKFLHCLPAHRGDEVTDGVMDHEQSIVFDQAENRMWAQMSLLTYLVDRAGWEAYADMMGLF
ncbi:MAG: ornithine carbamoyltransferase [Methanobacteriota archaeon]|nr:MAG: ornithine carbamoyltransferase [Euryarchaeota archaeon]HIK78922.1 ornithine carbamoyltransferase [Candidatus Poseidoniales archaeon]